MRYSTEHGSGALPVVRLPRARAAAELPVLDPVPQAAPGPAAAPELPAQVRIGEATLDCPGLRDAVDRVLDLALAGRPAYVVTANADHIVRMERHRPLAAAYRDADLALLDGQPLVWTARVALRRPVERVTGVDLFEGLCARAADEHRLFMLGGSEENSARAEQELRRRFPRLRIVGRSTAAIGQDSTAIVEQIRRSGANVVAVFLGCPKQEVWVHDHLDVLPPGVYLCLGGTVDIVSGALPRAGGRWQRLGLEWLHRLTLEPGRLWRRYLVDDPRVLLIAARSVRLARRGVSAPRVLDLDAARDVAGTDTHSAS